MSSEPAVGQPFRARRAIARGLRLLRRNSLLCGLLLAVTGTLVFAAAGILTAVLIDASNGEQVTVVVGPATAWVVAVIGLGAMLLIGLGHTLASHAAAQDLRKERVGMASAWSACWRHWLPVTAILAVVFVLAGVGGIVLVVPGLAVLTVFALAAPARVIDGMPLSKTFEHSVRTAAAGGWGLARYLLAASVLVFLLLFGANWAVGELQTAILMNQLSAENPAPRIEATTIVLMVLQLLLVTFAPFLFGVISAAAYAELKAGSGDQALSSVFD
ncbi:MAG TPA: hypothetical protein VEA44_10145 [Caulobacter sp.]|nr:hypothetical protein [Caulobacter sp.]